MRLMFILMMFNLGFTIGLTIILTGRIDAEAAEREEGETHIINNINDLEKDLMSTKERCEAIIQWHEATHPHSALKSER